MTCRVEANQTWIMSYNEENRLAKVEKVQGSCASPGTVDADWAFTYDGDGVRVMQAYDNGTTTTTTLYFAGGSYEIQNPGIGQTVLRYYAIAGQRIAVDDGASLTYLLTDHLGSVVATLNDSGTLLSQTRYLPFGGARDAVGTISETDFGFTGQRDLPEIVWMDYRSRFYASELGRFTKPDTIIPNPSNPQTLNRFSYADNNPIRFTDPTGHKFEDNIGSSCDAAANPNCGTVDASKFYQAELERFTREKIFRVRPRDGRLVLRNTYTDLEAMAAIADYAASLYNPYAVASEDVWTAPMLQNLSNVFLGTSQQGFGTLASADGYTTDFEFGASGFHADFYDPQNQVRHLWGFIAETSYAPGGKWSSADILANLQNFGHETGIAVNSAGRSYNDYVLSQAGISIGNGITSGSIRPSTLGSTLLSEIGHVGSGGTLSQLVDNPPWWGNLFDLNFYQPP